MGTDDLFKKRREDRKKRKHGYRTPRANSYLIVTEGTQTEPLYFRGIQKIIQDRLGGNVDIVELPVIDIKGEGCSTEKLNIGCIYIFLIVILHCTVQSGMKNWMDFLRNTILAMGGMRKIMWIYIKCLTNLAAYIRRLKMPDVGWLILIRNMSDHRNMIRERRCISL